MWNIFGIIMAYINFSYIPFFYFLTSIATFNVMQLQNTSAWPFIVFDIVGQSTDARAVKELPAGGARK
jgi:hypothetical protein